MQRRGRLGFVRLFQMSWKAGNDMKRKATTTRCVSNVLSNLVCDVRINLARGANDTRWIGFARNLVANHPGVKALLTAEELAVIG